MRKYALIFVAIVAMLALSACQRSAAPTATLPQPQATPTILSGGPATGGGEAEPTQDQMALLQLYATQTAMVESGGVIATGTPEVASGTQAVAITPTADPMALPSVTPDLTLPTLVPTATSAVAALPTSAPLPAGARPATYTLQQGEFPYCLARRFDVNPDDLLSLNGLTDSQLLQPGTVLKIPQSGSFPGTRALRAHPTTYTVTVNDTIFSIACQFGDLTPEQIAAANGLAAPYKLNVGTVLNIP